MNIRKLLTAGCLLPICFNSFSKPYLPIPELQVMTNGDSITIKTHGDEHFYYTTTLDDKLVDDSAGVFFYVDNKGLNSGVKVADEDHRTDVEIEFLNSINQDSALAAYHKRIGDKLVIPQPEKQRLKKVSGINMPEIRPITKGKKKIPVILVESSQKRMITNTSDWDEMLNQNGYNKNGHIGSIKEYFLAQSDGKLEMDFEVFGPVFLSQRVDQMKDADILQEALNKVTGDFSAYDADNNGYIDCTILVVAGQNTKEDNGKHGIYTFNNKYNGKDVKVQGKKAGDYIYTTECSAYSKNEMDGQGSIIHEMGHVLGLPDLYPVETSENVDTPKEWDVMDMGCYNGWAKNNTICGVCVPNFSFLERMCLGWEDPVELTADSIGQYTLPEMTEGKAYLVKTNKANEMFVIENRQHNGWDKKLPGHGMLVWHFDYDSDLWFYGKSNESNNDRHIFIEPASQGNWNNKLGYYSYPGNGNVRYLHELKDKSGNTYHLNINDITENNGFICFSTDGESVKKCPCVDEVEPSEAERTLADKDIAIYYDANSGTYTVKAANYPISWELINANGVIVNNGTLTENRDLKLGNNTKGIYVLRLKNALNSVAKTIVNP